MRYSTVESELCDSLQLGEVFTSECVAAIPSGEDKVSVLRRLVTLLARAEKLSFYDTHDVVLALHKREQAGSTALGNGLAFPHVRTNAVNRYVGAIGLAWEGVDFEALDGLPTRVVFLLLSPAECTSGHLRLLEHLTRLLADRTLQHSLEMERTPEEFLALLGFTDDARKVFGR